MKKYKIVSLIIYIIFSFQTNANLTIKDENIMSESQSLEMVLEITRVGITEKWNSSFFLEGSLKIHVLKNGKVTNRGIYTLSKNKFGFPVAIRVYNLDDKNKHFNFIVSPTSETFFEEPIYINVEDLANNNIFYNGTELLTRDSFFYKSIYAPKYIYKHTFTNKLNGKVIYEFYSPDKEVKDEIKFIKLDIKF